MHRSAKIGLLFTGVFIIFIWIGVNIGISKANVPVTGMVQTSGSTAAKKATNLSANEYQVISLKKGTLYVKQVKSGELWAIHDQALIRKAIRGEIKRGDMIRL
ncbi:hypothetical protein [Aneurinibacillus terranovensis]|uniref:hypothetical protein n=1 Tax=Aneurinibacillus terranovensis TaxID=278991 RepID=UPI00042841B7|nr:hypothetical protein [Aneurinibacillus terranovensis]